MDKHICMEAEFQLKSVSNKENTIPLWAKSMHLRILTHSLTQLKIFTMKFSKMINIITTTMRLDNPNFKLRLQGQRFSTPTIQPIGTSNRKSTLSMTCKTRRENSAPQEVTCFYSTYQTTWKIQNCINSLKSSATFWAQESWLKRTEKAKESGS